MKVCKSCKHKKAYHGIFGCIVVVDHFGLINEIPITCDCMGWNTKKLPVMLYHSVFEVDKK